MGFALPVWLTWQFLGKGVMITAVAAAIAAGAFLVYDYSARGIEIADLKNANVQLQTNLEIAKGNVKQAKAELAAIEKHNLDGDKDLDELCKLYKSIPDDELPSDLKDLPLGEKGKEPIAKAKPRPRLRVNTPLAAWHSKKKSSKKYWNSHSRKKYVGVDIVAGNGPPVRWHVVAQ